MGSGAPCLLTTLVNAPAQFTQVVLTKRHLLSGPVIVLVQHLEELPQVLPDYLERLQGIVMTPTDRVQLAQLSPALWHVGVNLQADALASVDILAAVAPGWLASIALADDASQRLFAADTRVERVARQLSLTRKDYNDMTSRLLAQVRDLTAAQDALGLLNQNLEARVLERTEDLAQANTQLSKTLENLSLTQQELVRKAQLAGLGSLVAGIAHELNTPIGTALTAATALAREAGIIQERLGEGQLGRRAFDQFLQNAVSMTSLLERNLVRAADSIGHFKQIATDGKSGSRQIFRMADVVSSTLFLLTPKLSGTQYRLMVDVDPCLEMDSYPSAIIHALTNFVDNALLHAFEGRNQGVMRIACVRCGDASLELSFSDDGVGVPCEHIDQIFQPFYTTKFGKGGSGLGLYTVYTQVRELLGGRVNVSSAPGQGTCFTVVLPLVAPVH